MRNIEQKIKQQSYGQSGIISIYRKQIGRLQRYYYVISLLDKTVSSRDKFLFYSNPQEAKQAAIQYIDGLSMVVGKQNKKGFSIKKLFERLFSRKKS